MQLVPVRGELTVQDIEGQKHLFHRSPLHRAGQAQTLELGVPGRHAVAVREIEGLVRIGELGLHRRAQVGDVEAFSDQRLEIGTRHFGIIVVVMALLRRLPLRVGDRDGDAELVVPVAAEEADDAGLGVLGVLVGAQLGGQGRLEAGVVVQGLAGEEADRAGHAALVLGRLEGLFDFSLGEKLRREDVEVEGPVAGALTAAVLRGVDVPQNFHTVELDAGIIRAEAAQRDPTSFARFTGDLDARQTLEALRQVQLGELCDVVGDDGVDLDGRVPLDGPGFAQRTTITGDHHLGHGGVARRRAGRLLRQRYGRNGARDHRRHRGQQDRLQIRARGLNQNPVRHKVPLQLVWTIRLNQP